MNGNAPDALTGRDARPGIRISLPLSEQPAGWRRSPAFFISIFHEVQAMRYLSLCSGIEAASVAWKPLGWEPVAFAEIEPFPCAVLSYHYPNVPNLGDMTQIDGARFRGQVDVLVAGTPCQAFSVAGARRVRKYGRGSTGISKSRNMHSFRRNAWPRRGITSSSWSQGVEGSAHSVHASGH